MQTGGDDLESDDEYLDQNWGRDETVTAAVDESISQDRGDKQTLSNKRGITEITGDDDEDQAVGISKKKKSNPKNLLLEAGRGIAKETPDVQAQFLWACYTNALKLRGEEVPEYKFGASHIKTSKIQEEREEPSKYDPSMSKFLKSGVLSSSKRLKKWKHNKCPMVLIICASAKRAVSILKEISSLNVRAAKLFARHMSISDQTAMLENNKYSIAVGTPNRLLKLTEENDSDEVPLSLDQTELIVIDCHEDAKRYTVCTMNDTAPDLMMFMKEAVVPQFKKRSNLKISFF